MAPLKARIKSTDITKLPNNSTNISRRGILTRTHQLNTKPTVSILKDNRTKRKANSPLQESKNMKPIDLGTKRIALVDRTKRTALGDVTNAVKNDSKIDPKNIVKKTTVQSKYLTQLKRTVSEDVKREAPLIRKTTQAKKTSTAPPPAVLVSEKNEDSLNVTAAKELIKSSAIESKTTSSNEKTEKITKLKIIKEPSSVLPVLPEPEEEEYVVPEGVHDFDKENWDSILQVSIYAMDIFNYLKKRESHFKMNYYMHKQPHINIHMRSLLVDWMVEVQESFELNHETLYLAVKLVDIYLNKVQMDKLLLQLVGAASLFIASKFDEQAPPSLEEFLYICDGAYEKRQLKKMEIAILKNCNFELGIPLSYRFLRRYARCAQVTMPTLTLARFILEYSLMDYTTITHSDSKLASAALYIALRMEKISDWTKTLEYYTGYKLEDFWPEVKILNNFLHQTPQVSLSTIRHKYSNKLFYEVAKKPLITL